MMSLLSRLPRFMPNGLSKSTQSVHSSHVLSRTLIKPSNVPPPLPPFPYPQDKPLIFRLPTHMLGKVAMSSMRPVLAAGVLAIAAGGTMVAQTDVLCISKAREGPVWFEKNKEHLAVRAATKKIVLDKEGGKWRARVNPEGRK